MQLKKYSFIHDRSREFGTILDAQGNERTTRRATDRDLENLMNRSGEQTSPSAHIHQLVLVEQDRFPTMKYTDAVRRVLARHPKIARLYAHESGGCVHEGPISPFGIRK